MPRTLICLLAALLLAGQAWAMEAAPVFRFTGAERWRIEDQKQADASVATEYDPALAAEVLRVDHAFIGTPDKHQFKLRPGVDSPGFPAISAVSLVFKGNGTTTRIQVGILDATGETFVHTNRLELSGGQWSTGTASFSDPARCHHWGGNNDGLADPPLSIHFIQIIAEKAPGRSPTESPFYLHALTVTGEAPTASAQHPAPAKLPASDLGLQIVEVGRFRPITPRAQEPLACVLKNPSADRRSLRLTSVHKRLLSGFSASATLEVSLGAGEETSVAIPMQLSVPGVHTLALRLCEDGRADLTAETVVNVWEPVGNDWVDAPETFFGGMESLDTNLKTMDQDLAVMRDAGVKLVRFVFRWRDIEPKEGEFSWAVYDQVFEACKRNHIIPYPILVRSPRWAVRPEILANAPPFAMDWRPQTRKFANFVSRAVERYKDYTKYWQIWNEPYARHYFWGGDDADYAELLKASYGLIKALDPTAQVNAPSFPTKESDNVFALTYGHYDNWPFHCHSRLPTLRADLNNIKKMMGDRYRSEAIWCDETGLCVDPAQPGSELEKAATIIKKLIACRAEGLGNHTWFIYRSIPKSALDARDNFAALDELGRLRPVVLAHNTAARCLRGTRRIQAFDLGVHGEVQVFARGEETVIAVLSGELSLGQMVDLTFGRKVKAEIHGLLGDRREIEVDDHLKLPLTRFPFFLVLKEAAVPTAVSVDSLITMPAMISTRAGQPLASTQLTISNPLSEVLAGTITILPSGGWTCAERTLSFAVNPGAQQTLPLAFSAASAVADQAAIRFQTSFRSLEMETSAELTITSARPLRRSAHPFIDGNLLKWTPAEVLAELTSKDSVQNLKLGDVDADLHWQGPSDLACTLSGSWDDQHLHLAMTVTDNRHHQQRNDGAIWDGDSVQIALACAPGKDQADLQVGMALTAEGGTAFHCWQGAVATTPACIVLRNGDQTFYEMAIPWTDLTFSPHAGATIFASVLVNDNDGRGRKAILEWGRGIHGNQSPGLFRPLYLEP